MEEGAKMDALVADRVLGLGPITWRRYVDSDRDELDPFDPESFIDGGRLVESASTDEHARPYGKDWVKDYSTDIAAAWEIVEKMEEDDQGITLHLVIPNSDPAVFLCRFGSHGEACEFTAPMAICVAALLAVDPTLVAGIDYPIYMPRD